MIELDNRESQGGGGGPAEPVSLVYPEDHGALGNGSHDDTSAIQACLDLLVANPGFAVFLSANKTYKVTSTLTATASNTQIIGASGRTSILQAATDYGDILVCDKGTFHFVKDAGDNVVPTTSTSSFVGVLLQNFRITSLVNRTSGSALRVSWSWGTTVDGVQFGAIPADTTYGTPTNTRLWDGLRLEYAGLVKVTGNIRIECQNVGAYISGKRSDGVPLYFGYDGVMEELDIWNNADPVNPAGSVGILIAGGCGGLTIGPGKCNCSYFETGILIADGSLDTAINEANEEIFVDSCFNDRCGTYGLRCVFALLLHITNGWGAGCGTGLYIDVVSTLIIAGGVYYQSTTDDINILSGSNVTLSGIFSDTHIRATTVLKGTIGSSVVAGFLTLPADFKVSGVTGFADVPTIPLNPVRTVVVITDTTYTLLLEHQAAFIEMWSNDPITITLGEIHARGFWATFVQRGTGQLTFVGDTSIDVFSKGGALLSAGQYSRIECYISDEHGDTRGNNTQYIISGDISLI